MKKEWQTTTLGDVAAVQSGAGFPDRYQGQTDGGIPFYKVSDMNIPGNEREMIHENNSITEEVRRELGAFLFPKGSTIFPKIGGAIATNKKRLTTRDSCIDNNVMGVVPKPGKIDSDFLYYFFLAHDLSDFANEAHLPSIKKTVVEAWPIHFPPLAEQQRIVSLLDEAFDGIATAKTNTEKNLQNARAMFASHLKTVFTQRDDGWPTKQLGDVCDFEGGSQPPKSQFSYAPKTGYVRFLQIRDFGSEKHVTFIPESKKNRLCCPDDVMIGRYGASVGKILTGKAGAYNVALMKTIPDLEQLHRSFFYYYLISGAFQEPLANVAARSAQDGFSKEDIYGFPVPIPPKKEQQKVIAQLGPLSEEAQRLESVYQRKLAALEALKESLLHQAFTGQLTSRREEELTAATT